MTTTDAVRYEVENGIVTLTIDDPDQSANTMNETYRASMEAAVDRLAREVAEDGDSIKGVIVTSAKKTFFAGGDLKLMTQATPDDAQALFDNVESIKATLRKLEKIGKPVVAAINGAALGGGLEIALACHHRIAAEGRYEIGLPEVSLGLLPGGGGVTRTVRMFGIQDALMNVLLQGQRNKPEKALKIGLIDEIVPAGELIVAARAWIESNAGNEEAASQPWDRPGYKIPGGAPSNPKLAAFLPSFPANLKKQLKGAPYIAPRHIMSAAVEGAQVDVDTASRIESRYLVNLLIGQQFKNMTQAFFFDLGAINAGGSRPEGIAVRKAEKLAVLGAGMMGAGIAYEAARVGIEVVLKDISIEAAEKGKSYSDKLLTKQVERGRLTQEKKDEILGRIQPTADYADLAGCDFVVEAVFESVELKHSVFGELEPIVNGDALLGSNTSTLPITTLAEGVQRPEDFIGIHFFSPVDKMQLVEIIVGEKTSDEALARAIDFTKQIRKIPIVVNDSRGFFTSRVFGTLVMEGVEMLAEGVDPTRIERASQLAGFPGQPLAMSDEVSLTLQQKIEGEARKAAAAEGKELPVTPAMEVVNKMVELGRPGKAAGAGFYEYPEGGKKFLWPELWDLFVKEDADVPLEDIKERLTFIMALETIRCFEEGVIRQVADANIGSIFGIGFPPVHGGALQYVNGYESAAGEIGVKAFTERAQQLAEKYGERFSPPALLIEKAEKGEKFA
ncbi:3-hydroxyacyl-CoA dehydrogenase NAD-binding domain-containing protein [Aeromicrobium duanguangcaii]|uniref:3-hydroxyacyl-CoA dehydrogenase NAD-binding domain-containing protein n=1 Tax=Aeromicrobium duanguangcaii TaxID=2968086 RepID=A0ABY5KD76_9ACTN|nr:3-hydroxyacyl-CoA dehydrogenase NAD-binding domain-containing protein [Aeromicrobium duanguangcaii]MCD9154532.1 3-hydroxyacyl-CoA dehydrogenase NAD-binding domain-containing protein [Aeromicrobium duanguangcaii]UUI68412.1 3-hydroxyacyl-CoA dehydrogenase NAD-binding domain-containing protein [Aeromicrobium duanguangcaii]